MLINPSTAYSPTVVLHLTSVTAAVSAANAPVTLGSFTAPRAGVAFASLVAYVSGGEGYVNLYTVRGSNTLFGPGNTGTSVGSSLWQSGNAGNYFGNTTAVLLNVSFYGASYGDGIFAQVIPVLPGDVVTFVASANGSYTVYVSNLWVVLV